MKRLIIVVCVVGLLAALPMSHLAAAGKGPAAKVWICHITGVGEKGGGTPIFVGHYISVSENAEAAHCAHGDHNPKSKESPEVGEYCQRKVDQGGSKGQKTCDGETPNDPPWF